jgi:hypothetical protein
MKVLAFACLLAVGKGAFLTVFPRENDALVWRSGEFVLALRSDLLQIIPKRLVNILCCVFILPVPLGQKNC